jgi:tRNA (mo5U34)-methyltransferase
MQQGFLTKQKQINVPAIQRVLRENKKALKDPRYERYQQALKKSLSVANKINKKKTLDHNSDFIRIKKGTVFLGQDVELDSKEEQKIKEAIQQMVPWRKGPFNLMGESVDAEWRSDLKWERVKKICGSLQGKVILDIGCNNGYYLYQIAKQNPKYLLGIDPVVPYYLQYEMLRQFYPLPNTDYFLMGVQDIVHMPKTFDVVFCMGILYHHPDPIGILRTIFQSLRPGGLLIVESLGINKPGSYCLFPQNRYTKMPGHWFVPTKEALENMLRRSGFQYIDTFYETKLLNDEQRKTDLCPVDGLVDGLDPNDNNFTVEGYEAPWRYYLKARRARIRR